MTAIVRSALRHPYTFVVMALLIMIFGVSSALRTPTDIFPNTAISLPYGGKVRQVQADLDQHALHAYGLSANDVVSALSIQNLITPVGMQKISSFEYTVNLNDSPTAIAAFNDLPVKTVNGTVIYMRDVAHVHDGSQTQTNVVHVDGKNAVLLSVIKAGAISTLRIISGIKSLLPNVEVVSGLAPQDKVIDSPAETLRDGDVVGVSAPERP